MRISYCFITLCCLFLLIAGSATAQEPSITADKVVVVGFEFEGNKRTRPTTIMRELDFVVGDSIALEGLWQRLKANEQLLLNMGLFNLVKLNISQWEHQNNKITVRIEVVESWYIYPVPIFELADRNFNVWWKEQNFSLERVNYGLRTYHINTTGRRDKSKLLIQGGYTQKYEAKYELPFFNKRQTFGLSAKFVYSRNRELPYDTQENKLRFYRSENDYPLKHLVSAFGISYRPGLRLSHFLTASYFKDEISDEVFALNPNYFFGKNKQEGLGLTYRFTYDHRGIAAYPISGEYFSIIIEKKGLGLLSNVNLLTIAPLYARYFTLDKDQKWSIALEASAKTQLIRKEIPYADNKSIGYGNDNVRGYELYVIDGTDFVALNTSLHYEVFKKNITFGKLMPFKAFKIMPLKIYLGLNSDIGYVNNPFYKQGNPLSNRMLWGGGIGLDVVILENKVFRIDYSLNHKLEKGVYLRYSLSL